MLTNVHLYIPEDRRDAITPLVEEKLKTLQEHSALCSDLIGLPDFGDDGYGLNGLYFKSKGVVFPAAIGDDSGCGYRVIHLTGSESLHEKIKNEFIDFAKLITSEKPGYQITKEDVESIYHHPVQWLLQKGVTTLTDEHFENKFYHYSSFIPYEDVIESFGRIARGNHFIEIRQVDEVIERNLCQKLSIEKGDILLHLHSGSGSKIEDALFEHWKNFNHREPLPRNGYLFYGGLEEEHTKQYLEDAERAYRLAYANRCILTHLLNEWLGVEGTILFDTTHDKIKIEENVVTHFKAVQTYSSFKRVPLAVIPSTISQPSFLVKQKTNFPLVNHGVGDGETGSVPTIASVLTNITKPMTRRFYRPETVLELSETLGWYEVLVIMNPWITIKNQGDW